jgi:hypothetical protein
MVEPPCWMRRLVMSAQAARKIEKKLTPPCL